jgi:hypothetical protein
VEFFQLAQDAGVTPAGFTAQFHDQPADLLCGAAPAARRDFGLI